MLLPEQYLLIYLFSIFLCDDKDIRILVIFCFVSFLNSEIFFYFLKGSPVEFIVISYGVELMAMVFIVQFIKRFWLRNGFIALYFITLIDPVFLLTLPYLLIRDDIVTNTLYYLCTISSYIINEFVVSMILYIEKDNKSKCYTYLKYFIVLNYIIKILLKISPERS